MFSPAFLTALQKVLSFEGGYVLHKNPTESDYTYAGIYRSAHPHWLGWSYIDRGETPPEELVEMFYYQEFWSPLHLLPDTIRPLVFDTAVNLGKNRAIKMLQWVLGTCQDGVLGPKTVNLLSQANPEIVKLKYMLKRIEYYVNLAANDKFKCYLRGWILRVLVWV